jgi:hypothetical protein
MNSSESKNTAFCYINRIQREIKRKLKNNTISPDVSYHRCGAIALAPGTIPGTIAVSFFISKPTTPMSPGYMKTAAIGRLNSVSKCVQISLGKDDSANLTELFNQTKLDQYITRNFDMPFDMIHHLVNSFAGAIKNLNKITNKELQST